MAKRTITHIAAIGIIFKKSDPRQILMEVKDDGFPRPAARGPRRGLSFFGGNRFGPDAEGDNGPIDTLRRRIRGRLALTHQLARPVELAALQQIPPGEFILKPNMIHEVEPVDMVKINALAEAICAAAWPMNSFLNNEPDGGQALVVVFECGLSDSAWQMLVELMERFGNISRLCPTIITNLDELVQTQMHSAFGINDVLESFWAFKVLEATGLMKDNNTIAEWCGAPMRTYTDYERYFSCAPTPSSPAR